MSASREPLSREALTELIGLGGDAGRDRYDGLLQLLHTLRGAPDRCA